MYFGYCYGSRNYVLYTKPIVDSGPGSPSDRTLSSQETAAFTVGASCGGRWNQGVGRAFLKRVDVFLV